MGHLGAAAMTRQTRRFIGPIVGAVRRDVPVATEVDENSSEDDLTAPAAYRQAEKSTVKKKGLWGKDYTGQG